MKKSILAMVACSVLAGCAHVPEGAGSNPNDPWERMNRQTAAFNDKMDAYLIEPVVKGYRAVTPEVVRTGVTNVFTNVSEPMNIANNALQGKGERTLKSIFRFLINTTLGLGGIFDVAAKFGGEPECSEDFGQTLATWGVPEGPYLVLPFLGPSTLRDGPSKVADWYSTPVAFLPNRWARWGLGGVAYVNTRSDLLSTTDLLKDAVDPYVMAREAFLSNRKNAVYDGNPPMELTVDEFEEE